MSNAKEALCRAGGLVFVLTVCHVGPLGPVKYLHVSCEVPELVPPPKRTTDCDAGLYVIEWPALAAGPETEIWLQLFKA